LTIDASYREFSTAKGFSNEIKIPILAKCDYVSLKEGVPEAKESI
jgi:hypothetical protein